MSGVILQGREIIVEWEILNFSSIQIILVFIFDYVSMFFIRLVSLISARVLVFRISYISGEQFSSRFLRLVILFVLSIFLLILSPNLVRILLGWDGLGVTSYLLVIFYQSNKSYSAGILTALTNRLGDVGILFCIPLIIYLGHWNYIMLSMRSIRILSRFTIIIIIAACTKSAQIPFSAWLPAAMAAPTPVSALVHSSTLVTAGVYLLIRFNILLKSIWWMNLLICLGILTILIAGVSASLETDIKKVIALSTLSQLGVIIMILGCQNSLLAYFHLLSHAYFKAILFMCAGVLIHNLKEYQDLRKIGGGDVSNPVFLRVITVANIRLCGLPFMSGFYSKDLILERILIRNLSIFTLFLILFSTIFTIIYSLRLFNLLRIKEVHSERMTTINRLDKWRYLAVAILYPFSIAGGLNLSWQFFSSSPLIFLPIWLKFSVLGVIILGILFRIVFRCLWESNKYFILSEAFKRIFFMPITYRKDSSNSFLRIGKFNFKLSESSWIEFRIYIKSYFIMKKYGKLFDGLFGLYFFNSIYIFSLILVFT